MSDRDQQHLPYIDEHGVLHDPDAVAFIHAVERENCRRLLKETMRERVEHFVRRISEIGRSPSEIVIVFLNVDDPRGGPLAGVLMPNNEPQWAAIRALGETPYARGLAHREGIQGLVDRLGDYDMEAERLRAARYAIVVMDRGIVACFDYYEDIR